MLPAIKAAAVLAGSRFSSVLRETPITMMMITMPAMMSSPAVASWTEYREREEGGGKGKNGHLKKKKKKKRGESGTKEETETFFHWIRVSGIAHPGREIVAIS